MLYQKSLLIPFMLLIIESCGRNDDSVVSCYTATKNSELVDSQKKQMPVEEVNLEILESIEKEPIQKIVNEEKINVGSGIITEQQTNLNTSDLIVADEEKVFMEQLKQSHADWDALLKSSVSVSGKVNYKLLKTKEADLDRYLTDLTNRTPKDWSRAEQLAYYINLYNASTVKLILEKYPVNSIKDINGGKPWDKVFIPLMGNKISLNQLEHDIIRPTFKDARVHFALNCAAASCPKLLNEAYTAEKIEAQLENQTRTFINNNSKNDLNPSEPRVSELFNWYQSDFGDVVNFINRYAKTPVTNKQLAYLEYSWDLNQ